MNPLKWWMSYNATTANHNWNKWFLPRKFLISLWVNHWTYNITEWVTECSIWFITCETLLMRNLFDNHSFFFWNHCMTLQLVPVEECCTMDKAARSDIGKRAKWWGLDSQYSLLTIQFSYRSDLVIVLIKRDDPPARIYLFVVSKKGVLNHWESLQLIWASTK